MGSWREVMKCATVDTGAPQRVQHRYRSVRKADPKKSRYLASTADQMQAFLISLTEKIYDSENDLSEQMIPLLVREIGFIQESENGNRTSLPLMTRWFTISIPFRAIWQCRRINYSVQFA
jgi:hypothetical protein